MAEISTYLEAVSSNQNLDLRDAERAFQIITSNGATPAQIAAFLVALKTKGETETEIFAAAKVLRTKMESIKLSPEIHQNTIDCCGTGGDKKGTLNISTAVSFVLAASGLNVAKHGNRAISSRSGSADVLRALGINADLTPMQAKQCLEDVGITFLFAPLYHRALVNIGPTRKELGIRTIFNILGPLCNPTSPPFQLIGVYSKSLVESVAKVAKMLGLKSAIVVSGEDGLDEISISAKTHASQFTGAGEIESFIINPEDYGFKLHDEAAILGKNAIYNAKKMKQLLNGEHSAYRDSVVINSAFALKIAGKVESVEDGIELASKILDEGRAHEKLKSLVEITNSFA